MQHRTDTHCARFQRHIEFAARQTVIAQDLRRGLTLIVVAGFSSWTAQRLVALARQATERAEAQATAMADQAAFTSAILATADDMILTFNPRGTIIPDKLTPIISSPSWMVPPPPQEKMNRGCTG
jgi:hypothetical protein